MRLFAPALAFVDLETTGTTAATDAITEIGIVRVEADPDGLAAPRVTEWSTLVNPGVSIPPEIQALTGITNEMVRDAPPFSRVADEVAARTADALFVAHNARFDYGFLKHAFARQERAFSARVLCTVRLSRRLFPGRAAAQSRQRHRAARVARRRTASCARRRARAVDLRAVALSRPRPGDDRSRGQARAENAEPAAAAPARRARRLARGAGRLSLLRPQRAAALHREEHESARAGRRALFVRLSLGDRPSPLERDPAHRIRGDGRRDRRAAARSGARQVDASGAQPRAAPQGRVRRASVAGGARTAARSFRPRAWNRESSPAGSDRSRRGGRRARRCARSRPSTRCAGKRWGSRSAWVPASRAR